MTGWYLFSFLLIISPSVHKNPWFAGVFNAKTLEWVPSVTWDKIRMGNLFWDTFCFLYEVVRSSVWWSWNHWDNWVIYLLEGPSHENSDGFLKSFALPTLVVLSRHIMRFLVKGSTIWWSFMIVVIVEWKKHWGSEVELVYFHNMPCVSLWGGLFLCNCLCHCWHKKFSNG